MCLMGSDGTPSWLLSRCGNLLPGLTRFLLGLSLLSQLQQISLQGLKAGERGSFSAEENSFNISSFGLTHLPPPLLSGAWRGRFTRSVAVARLAKVRVGVTITTDSTNSVMVLVTITASTT